MLNLLKILLVEQQENFEQVKNSIPREVHMPTLPNKIKVALGMRRTGKTYFLLQEVERLKKEKKFLQKDFCI